MLNISQAYKDAFINRFKSSIIIWAKFEIQNIAYSLFFLYIFVFNQLSWNYIQR